MSFTKMRTQSRWKFLVNLFVQIINDDVFESKYIFKYGPEYGSEF